MAVSPFVVLIATYSLGNGRRYCTDRLIGIPAVTCTLNTTDSQHRLLHHTLSMNKEALQPPSAWDCFVAYKASQHMQQQPQQGTDCMLATRPQTMCVEDQIQGREMFFNTLSVWLTCRHSSQSVAMVATIVSSGPSPDLNVGPLTV